ncbi:MAG: nucleotidyltransferase domain-containing protein [Nanoarchaeota archaeon]|nr:nucleotidyltransferase domain-containing protein [Nanoarchaeota archaeon]
MKKNRFKQKSAQLSKKILNTVDVFSLYTLNYKLGIHGRELSKKISGSQRMISNKLKFLAGNNILKCEEKGTIKNYYLNLENPLVFDLMIVAEQFQTVIFLSSDFKLMDLFGKMRDLTSGGVVVFGSYARGDSGETSDLDVLVLGNYDKKKMKDLTNLYPIKVHIMQMSKKIFERGLFNKENFMLEVLRDHIVVKGTSELVDLFWRYYNG